MDLIMNKWINYCLNKEINEYKNIKILDIYVYQWVNFWMNEKTKKTFI